MGTEQSASFENNEITNTKQQQQQQQQHRQRNVQMLAENLRLKMQQFRNGDEMTVHLQHREHIFDPFDFANLRQLQEKQKQITERQKYKNNNNKHSDNNNNNNNNNNRNGNVSGSSNSNSNSNRNENINNYNGLDGDVEIEDENGEETGAKAEAEGHPYLYQDETTKRNEHQQRQWQSLHAMHSKDNQRNNKNINNHNEGNEYNSGYPGYLFENNNMNNKNDNAYNKAFNDDGDGDDDNDDGNNDDDGNDDDVVVGYGSGNPSNGDYTTPPSTHQDANNDFRLKLSDRNEPVSNKHESNNSKNKNNNSRNNNNSNNKNNNNSKNNKSINTKSKKNNFGHAMYTVNIRNVGHSNSRTVPNNAHNSGTHEDIYNNNNPSENNERDSIYSNSNSNGAVSNTDTDTSNERTIKIRGSQSEDLAKFSEYDFNQHTYNPNDELVAELPYGIQNAKKRSDFKATSTTYQSLCLTKRVTIPLNTIGYEYRPNHYTEVTCAHNAPANPSHAQHKNKICSEAGFSCIQLNRTIHLIRRSKLTPMNCWESEIRIVPSGCECMWPMHNNGDIAYHHNAKRFNPAANINAAADYRQGFGYRQLPRQIELFDFDGDDDDSGDRQRLESNDDAIGYETYTEH